MTKMHKLLDESVEFQTVLYKILCDNLDEDECVDSILQDSLEEIAEAIDNQRQRGSMWG
tara:strand:+ start:190 stop:366 length:177 start_codon:yes stop_codon:yes gene_type:complete